MSRKQPRVTKQDAIDFVTRCLDECEADGYQQQEGDPIHEHAIDFSTDDNSIWVTIGERTFRFRCTEERRLKHDT